MTAADLAPVFVVGAGPSGLAAAHRLRAEGRAVVVLESRDRVGGQVSTHREQGYLMERGATILPSAYEAVLRIVRELGIFDELIPAGSVVGFARGDTIHELRSDHLFLDAARSRLMSTRSKLAMARFALDDLRIRRHLNYDDLSSVAAWDTMTPKEYCGMHRGLGGEVYDYVIDSTVRGVLGTRGDVTSVAELFFMLHNILGSKLYAFRGGFSTYVDAISRGLDVRLGATAQEVVETPTGVRVTWVDAAGATHVDEGSGAVVTTRGDLLPDLLPGHLDGEAEAFLRSLRYTKTVSMNTGVTRKPEGLAASVINVPRAVDEGLMGFTCEHNKAPGRAPEGHGLLCLLAMTEWAETLIHEDDETIRDAMLAALEKLLPGVSDTVDYVNVSRWNEVVVYSRPGLYRELGDFTKRLDPGSRIRLGGIFFSSSNICTATAAGERAVRELRALAPA